MSKKSIRFFNDREVRMVWDDESNCWWFSATDVVRAINDEPDDTKAANYWRWLKRKQKQEDVQFVSATHKLNKALLKGALTDKINDRERFMKGIDYSYYYEEG